MAAAHEPTAWGRPQRAGLLLPWRPTTTLTPPWRTGQKDLASAHPSACVLPQETWPAGGGQPPSQGTEPCDPRRDEEAAQGPMHATRAPASARDTSTRVWGEDGRRRTNCTDGRRKTCAQESRRNTSGKVVAGQWPAKVVAEKLSPQMVADEVPRMHRPPKLLPRHGLRARTLRQASVCDYVPRCNRHMSLFGGHVHAGAAGHDLAGAP